MNRWLIVAAMGLIVGGCAAGVEDPQPEPSPPTPQKQAPAQTFSGEISENPYEKGVSHSIGDGLPQLPEIPIEPLPNPGR
jgi:hypothetical protein